MYFSFTDNMWFFFLTPSILGCNLELLPWKSKYVLHKNLEVYKVFFCVVYIPILISNKLFNKDTLFCPKIIFQAQVFILQKRRAYSLGPYLYKGLKEIWELLSWKES